MQFSKFTLTAVSFAALVLLPSAAHSADLSTKPVLKALEARDCPAAVKELNSALAGASSEALLLGGVMFEQGLCLKKNLERAARLYAKAADAGAPGAKSRLAGLFAAPASGPDKGAALWWAYQAGLPLPKSCTVESSVVADSEKLAQALGAWPASMLDACVHVAGVLAAIDAEFVVKPIASGGDGISVDFRPSAGTLDVRTSQSAVALVDNSPRTTATSNAGSLFAANNVTQGASPEQMLALRAQEERLALSRQVESAGKDALARFPRPNGVDADWRIQLAIEGARER
ncbi:MAG: hypothetical protein CFE44_14730 [Burkholderiales bacterium PBB4]|nr:MAG: hypothetical protein CFE44_14730 [Burkholderiales bacterium PBB4]